ncbi:hypothetical protein AB0B07_17045 [Streptomyces sioyaensis]|uniref:hypothetical protein n=1 Tax=Streptomyces sioyaensis TaxID=67364 RepID=UPI0033CDC619
MPEPLRRAVHRLVSEAVANLQEVLRYTEPDQAHTWKRMTLYRATEASDTRNRVAMLIAAYCQRTGMSQDRLTSYLQTTLQHSRGAGPTKEDRAHLAGLLGEPAPEGTARSVDFLQGQLEAKAAQHPEDAAERLFTEACLHGLKARLCDDVDSLDSYLPPQMAAMARKVADGLEVPQPTPA